MIAQNVSKVREEIAAACRSAGRKPEEVMLVGVTKYAPLEAIQEALSAGLTDIAENRVQEAERKFPPLLAANPNVRCHLIGHLQTNKARDIVNVGAYCNTPLLIQSVDSLKLASEIEKHAAKQNKTVQIFVQFNTAEEPQKFGAKKEEALSLIEGIGKLAHVRIMGLMAMAPYTEDLGVIRRAFSDLRGIRDQVIKTFSGHQNIQMKTLSMGMSADYRIAIEEGSNMIRVGSAIFKEAYVEQP